MLKAYNGLPASPDKDAINIQPFKYKDATFPGGIRGEFQVIFLDLIEFLDTQVEPIDLPGPDDEWGYYYKVSANDSSLISVHAAGGAADYNATRHPNGVHGTWTNAQVATIDRYMDRYEGCLFWREHAPSRGSRIDGMHWEIDTDDFAFIERITNKIIILRGGKAPAPKPHRRIDEMNIVITAANRPHTLVDLNGINVHLSPATKTVSSSDNIRAALADPSVIANLVVADYDAILAASQTRSKNTDTVPDGPPVAS